MEHDFKNYPELTNAQLEQLQFDSKSPHQYLEDFSATVVKVHDGDTVTLRTDERDFDFPLRFLDIDAPELSEGGEEAKEYVKDRLEGEEVTIIIDRNNRVGRYGRLLGQVKHSGSIVGEDELRLGLAKPFGKKNEGKIPNINKTLRLKQWF